MGYLPGVRVRDLKMLPDERGFFCELLRGDWDDLLGDEPIVQANLSVNYPGIIRAWHQHVRGKVDYHVVLKGAMKICAYDAREESETRGHLSEVVLNSERLQVVRIPGHYWHGVKNVGSEPSTTIYFHNKLYDYDDPDEGRRPWNDPEIVPVAVNGDSGDPRAGKPWDWDYPPHR